MRQSRAESLRETVAHTLVRFGVSALATAYVLPLVGVDLPLRENLAASAVMTRDPRRADLRDPAGVQHAGGEAFKLRRTIMSVQALQWAHEQKVGHPEAKLVLILLAAASGGPEAVCFPDLEKLAEQAEVRKQQGLVIEIEPDFEFLILPSDDDSRALAADPDRAGREFADYLPSRRKTNLQK